MCRNIRVLFNFEPPTTDEEVEAAALQYVRKVSGTRKPSKANVELFKETIREIARLTRRLVDGMEATPATPKRTREGELAKARARNAKRFGPEARR